LSDATPASLFVILTTHAYSIIFLLKNKITSRSEEGQRQMETVQ